MRILASCLVSCSMAFELRLGILIPGILPFWDFEFLLFLFVIVFFVFLNLSLCLVIGLCSYVLVMMFKSTIMLLCILVQNELDLNLCILLFLIS